MWPKDGRKPFVQTYTRESGEFAAWRDAALLVMRAARARAGRPPLEGPVGLNVVFLFTMPKGEHRIREPRPRRWHTSKPDVDNALKAIMDAAVMAGWVADDAPVAQVNAQKIVAAQGEEPGAHVTLFALPPIAAPAQPTLLEV